MRVGVPQVVLSLRNATSDLSKDMTGAKPAISAPWRKAVMKEK
jgi:hypothetical protein